MLVALELDWKRYFRFVQWGPTDKQGLQCPFPSFFLVTVCMCVCFICMTLCVQLWRLSLPEQRLTPATIWQPLCVSEYNTITSVSMHRASTFVKGTVVDLCTSVINNTDLCTSDSCPVFIKELNELSDIVSVRFEEKFSAVTINNKNKSKACVEATSLHWGYNMQCLPMKGAILRSYGRKWHCNKEGASNSK